ncbi:hypothetical protein K0M31_002392 [Melipona bicolor]|uniref:Uncharacterized protein n=1 Tax=Melipona bicolor TaxID=60889 RepID=A0AA40KYT6_9HYME|nr:hypothetical protein K0M31_002392 [Melipona bicolor]
MFINKLQQPVPQPRKLNKGEELMRKSINYAGGSSISKLQTSCPITTEKQNAIGHFPPCGLQLCKPFARPAS